MYKCMINIGKLKAFATGLLIVLTFTANLAWGLTVDNVIGMHQAKLPPSVIIQTLKSSGAEFNLSLADMKKLKAANIPQEVIDAMLPTKSDDSLEPEPEPEAETGTEVQADQSEEEKKIAEAARKAAETAAREKREELKKARMKQIAKRLSNAEQLLLDKDFVNSLKAFDDFLQSEDQTPEGSAQAQFGLAESLFGLGLYANAMVNYEEILQTAPEENPVFEKSFYRFRQCSQMVSYEGLPGALTEHYIGNFSKEFQNSYNYFLGKLFFSAADPERAILYLDRVEDNNPDYARAQYVLGLIKVNQGEEDNRFLIEAIQNFQRAVDLVGRNSDAAVDGLDRVGHLAYLSLARLSYTLATDYPELYSTAIFYYRKIPSDSTNYIEALYESAWAYFLKGNIKRGMGIFHTLEGPDWNNHYLPDTHLLEAQVFLNLCRTGLAQQAIKRLEEKYLNLKPTLKLYIETYEETIFEAFVQKKLKRGLDLPRRLYLSVLSDSRFNESYMNVARYTNEIEEIKTNQNTFGEALTARLLERANDLLEQGKELLSQMILQTLRDREEELDSLDDKVERMRFEIESQNARNLEQQIEKSYDGEIAQAKEAASSQTTASLLVGDKYLTWPFEGEFWEDEINSYRSYLTSQCREEQ